MIDEIGLVHCESEWGWGGLSLNWDPRIIGNYLELKEVSVSYRTGSNEEPKAL